MADQLAVRKPEVRRSLAEGLIVCAQYRTEDSERLAFGQAIHTFIAAYTRHLQARRLDSDLAQVARLASEAWARTDGLRHDRHDEFMDLADLFARSRLGQTDTILTVEQTLVRDVGFAIVNCTPDRVDRADDGDPDDDPSGLLVTDYKSEEGEMDHFFQERWYVHQALLEWPSARWVDFAFDPIRHPREPEVRRWWRGETDQWWETQMEALRLRLLAPDAPPHGGPACESCALRRTCAAVLSQYRAIPESDDEADLLLEEYQRHAAAAKLRWGALEPYYRDRPMRVVHGQEIGYLETREQSFELLAGPSQMVLFAFLSGLDPWAFVRAAPASSLVNRGIRDQLAALGVAQWRTKPPEFKTRRAEPERKQARRRRREEEC